MGWIDYEEWLFEQRWKEELEPLALKKTYDLTPEEMEEFRIAVDILMKKWEDEGRKRL
jgi:hypothetical protein